MTTRRNETSLKCVRLYAPELDESMPQSGAELWICVEGAEKAARDHLVGLNNSLPISRITIRHLDLYP